MDASCSTVSKAVTTYTHIRELIFIFNPLVQDKKNYQQTHFTSECEMKKKQAANSRPWNVA